MIRKILREFGSGSLNHKNPVRVAVTGAAG